MKKRISNIRFCDVCGKNLIWRVMIMFQGQFEGWVNVSFMFNVWLIVFMSLIKVPVIICVFVVSCRIMNVFKLVHMNTWFNVFLHAWVSGLSQKQIVVELSVIVPVLLLGTKVIPDYRRGHTTTIY